MSTAVVKEIPHGAIVTVFLHSGKWFKGIESSTDQNRQNKVLRLEKELTGGLSKGNVTVFCDGSR